LNRLARGYWPVRGIHKLDALSRILEAETFDAILIFVKTKVDTIEVAEQLQSRGFAAAALNGDIPQNQRERLIEQLKSGKLNILVATDVAARGLDVDRISHVSTMMRHMIPKAMCTALAALGVPVEAGKPFFLFRRANAGFFRLLKRLPGRLLRQWNCQPLNSSTANALKLSNRKFTKP
jgi:ATP-dependent RNA helicase DeaD